MELFELVLLLLGSVLISTIFDRIIPRVSLPLVQIGIGVIVALLWPNPMDIELDPDLFLVIFVAPLLFNESRRSDLQGLWQNKWPILSLAVGLVIITMLVVGFVLNWIQPSIPLAAAFALGAALGPTDAVAVTSLAKRINMSKRQHALLSGEALINDASGVVGFQFALAAAVTGVFSLLDATVEFLVLFLGGIGIGLVLGLIATVILRLLRRQGLESTTVHVVFEVFMPFFTFLVAEQLGTSGVLAVVAAGLLMTFFPGKKTATTTRINIVSNSVWDVLIFVINGIVFVLLGMQLTLIVSPTWDSSSMSRLVLIATAVLITVVVMGVRLLWMLGIDLVGKDRDTGKRRKLSWKLVREALATTLSGPKGAVTLSIAFTFPYFISTAVAFPHRSDLIFIASGVIVLTLLMATFIVPLLVPNKEEEGSLEKRRTSEIEILNTVRSWLLEQYDPTDDPAAGAVVRYYDERIVNIMENNVAFEEVLPLREDVLEYQYSCIEQIREKGEISRSACDAYEDDLDRMDEMLEKTTNKLEGGHSKKHAKRFRRRRRAIRVRSAVRNFFLSDEGVDDAESHERSELFKQVERSSLDYLSSLLDTAEPNSERAKAIEYLLNEHRMTYMTLETQGQSNDRITLQAPDVDLRGLTGMRQAPTDDKLHARIVEIEAEALRFELDTIQSMYDDDLISRDHASQLREEVYLLQMSLGTR